MVKVSVLGCGLMGIKIAGYYVSLLSLEQYRTVSAKGKGKQSPQNFDYDLSVAVILWHRNGVRRCLACASVLLSSQDQEWVVSRCNRAKTAPQYLLLRCESGLAASMPWLKFGEIAVCQ